MPESTPLYTPFRIGRYTVAPGLFPLRTDFGNGAADAHLFQFDGDFPRYRENKLRCRREDFGKYVCEQNYDPRTAEAVARLMVMRLMIEHPESFTLEMQPGGAGVLHCHRTGDRLAFDPEMRLIGDSAYRSSLDALCCQIMEDVAVTRVGAESDQLVALHICAPSGWAAAEKIGQSFLAAHAPVAGFEKVTAAAKPILRTVVERPPFTRFAWSIEFTNRLNLHPDPPPDVPAADWHDRSFHPDADIPLYVRVERQVLWGLPEVEAFLFTIRVYLIDGRTVRADPDLCDALRSALLGMSPESRAYKGLTDSMDAVIAWLDP